MRSSLLLLLLVGSIACGSPTPAAPTPQPASVAGTWSGTMQYTVGTTNSITAILLVLTQAGANVNGTWAISNANGTVTGTTTSAAGFSGTFTFNAATNAGAPCTGTWAVSGTETTNTLNWISPGVSGTCGGLPTNVIIAAQIR